jgi:hypothetical protein
VTAWACTGSSAEAARRLILLLGSSVDFRFLPDYPSWHETGAAKSQPAGNGSYAGQTAWGGWGSNPRPADYEAMRPSLPRMASFRDDLQRSPYRSPVIGALRHVFTNVRRQLVRRVADRLGE